jgi:hypothetical protein
MARGTRARRGDRRLQTRIEVYREGPAAMCPQVNRVNRGTYVLARTHSSLFDLRTGAD